MNPIPATYTALAVSTFGAIPVAIAQALVSELQSELVALYAPEEP